ncbi:thioredoxin family protein [Terrimonas ferruginea]|uniref:thioredoxin family protein n=1 Tax=Terrimonas ferruginea TaxID=249 RepID=UPI000425964A|nr:thioredoxin family protein [Terrimonas ferruginea]
MEFSNYLKYFEEILLLPEPLPPYDNPAYLDYTRLNWSRMNRWLKHGVLLPEVEEAMAAIKEPRHWIIITEPWCGDAAHSVPFIERMAALNPLVTTSYELRDSPPFLIEKYLTGTSKSIPKLIIRNAAGEDLATWGPRPADCQVLYQQLIDEKADFETVKTALQQWYNKDHGRQQQQELLPLISL